MFSSCSYITIKFVFWMLQNKSLSISLIFFPLHFYKRVVIFRRMLGSVSPCCKASLRSAAAFRPSNIKRLRLNVSNKRPEGSSGNLLVGGSMYECDTIFMYKISSRGLLLIMTLFFKYFCSYLLAVTIILPTL